MFNAVLHFPVLLTTVVAVVVSFIQNAEQQCKQMNHFVVKEVATTAGT